MQEYSGLVCLCVEHFNLFVADFKAALVADLAAFFGVKRRLLKHDKVGVVALY